MNIVYPAYIKQDPRDKKYLVKFPDLTEAITEGKTLDEALYNAAEALTLTLEGRMDEKMDIPKPSKRKNAYSIVPSARVQAALLIHFNKGTHKNAKLARSLETSWPAIARLEDPHHWPSLRQLERLAGAIGQKLILSMEPIS